jgi:hypothetical protein
MNILCPWMECKNTLNDEEIEKHLNDKDIFIKF